MAPKHQRMIFTFFGIALLMASGLLMMDRFRENIVFFFSPSDLLQSPPQADEYIRVGGLVTAGSVQQVGTLYQFSITDTAEELAVQYNGIPPALFREGQGVVAEGYWQNGMFNAEKLLAKHDENYMPPEVADALKKHRYSLPHEASP